MEIHHTSNQSAYLEVKMVKVTRPINAHTVNTKYLPNGKAYKFRAWFPEAVRSPASPTSAVTSKVKRQGRKVTWCVWQVLADRSRTKSHQNIKNVKKVAHLTGNNTMLDVKRSKVNVISSINAETESVSPTNFKLGRRLEHALSTATASYKGLVKLGYCRGHTVSSAPATATQLVDNYTQ